MEKYDLMGLVLLSDGKGSTNQLHVTPSFSVYEEEVGVENAISLSLKKGDDLKKKKQQLINTHIAIQSFLKSMKSRRKLLKQMQEKIELLKPVLAIKIFKEETVNHFEK